jgi:fructoselysine-6-P-deglycase FrlB-like protein
MLQNLPDGRAQIAAEMNRQHADALTSFAQNAEVAARIVYSIRRTGRLVLLGMGGSHWVNRTAMFLYRQAGIEVQCEVLSEALHMTLPDAPRTVILTSQSGGSGEISHYLDMPVHGEERFGLTLNKDSILAGRVQSLIGAGGVELAFAATRSILISQALHAAVLSALGVNMDQALEILKNPPRADVSNAIEILADCPMIIFSGRSELQGVAENAALCLMELARMPTYAFEGGQFRHGPMELIIPETGVVLLRSSGITSALTVDLAKTCRTIGCPVVVFDVSGELPVEGVETIGLPLVTGFAATFAILPILQSLIVEIAARKVPALGVPLRSKKVTTLL